MKRTKTQQLRKRLPPSLRAYNIPRPLPLPRVAKGEVKTHDTAIDLEMDANSAVADCMKLLNEIPTGTSAITRIGKRVCLKAINIRGFITARTATTLTNVAILLIWIRTPNQSATLPAVTDILTTQNFISQTNRDNATKFKIVRRWNYSVIGNSTTPATGKETIPVDEYVPFKKGKYESVWTNASTTGAIGGFENGALILLTIGDTNNGETTTPDFLGTTRLYFEDL